MITRKTEFDAWWFDPNPVVNWMRTKSLQSDLPYRQLSLLLLHNLYTRIEHVVGHLASSTIQLITNDF